MKIDISIMSYNFNERFNNWKLRKTLINELLNNIEFDILCAQEFTSKMKVNDFSKLCDYQIIPTFNVPIFIRKGIEICETYENTDTLTRLIKNSPEKHGKRFNAVSLDVDGKGLLLVNCHLHHLYFGKNDAQRALEIYAINDFVNNLELHENLPVIICGDFNCRPNTLPIKIMKEKGFVDIHDGLITNESYNGYGTHSGDKIDYVFTKNADSVETKIITKQIRGMYPSDHNPIYTTLNI